MTATYTKMLATTTEWLARHSIDALRISVGLVFLGFGFLKFFPGVSPAEDLAVGTLEQLTFGVVSGGVALAVVAATECFIGLTMITGRFLKAGLLVMAGALVGFMSPLVLFFTDMFPGGPPTLEAQYILKDIVLVTAAMVIAARALGARLVPARERTASDVKLAA
ncbi:DoxX family protein [Nonomuraea sp. B5E05]|uniref:DoxX family protein n=1 Tax=Nonomuraea sp. B5E05 TaxID=3153569 RepID=UPI003260AF37